jgi:hypothetical protein
MTRSGAVLTWEYFHPASHSRLMYVQDLTWGELPFSQEVSAALRSYKPF